MAIGKCVLAILGVLVPPLAVFLQKGANFDFWINLVLSILLLWIGGIIHAFHLFGVTLCTNILSVFLPPLAVYLEYGLRAEFWLSLILTLCFWIPGVIYSYFVAMRRSNKV